MKKIVERINKANSSGGLFHDSRHDVNTLGKAINIAFDKINEIIDFLATLNTENKKEKDVIYSEDLYDCIFIDKDGQIVSVLKRSGVSIGEVIHKKEEKRFEKCYGGGYEYRMYIINTIITEIKEKTGKEITCICKIDEVRK